MSIFAAHRFMRPVNVRQENEMRAEGYLDKWICYRSAAVSAKELTILPGRSVLVKDAAAYGMIVMQGHGTMDGMKLETPALIRFGQLTCDEYFVSEATAKNGVRITNDSDSDPLVMLKHFGPANPDLNIA